MEVHKDSIASVVIFFLLFSLGAKSASAQQLNPSFANYMLEDRISDIIVVNYKLNLIRSEYDIDSVNRSQLHNCKHYTTMYATNTANYSSSFLPIDSSNYMQWQVPTLQRIGASFYGVLLSDADQKYGVIDGTNMRVSLVVYDSLLQLLSVNLVAGLESTSISALVTYEISDSTMALCIDHGGGLTKTVIYEVNSSATVVGTDTITGVLLPRQHFRIGPNYDIVVGNTGACVVLDSARSVVRVQALDPLPGNWVRGISYGRATLAGMPVFVGLSDSAAQQFNRIFVFAYDSSSTNGARLLYKEELQKYSPVNSFYKEIVNFTPTTIAFGDCLEPCAMNTPNIFCASLIRVHLIDTFGNLRWTRTLGGDAAYQGNQLVAVDGKLFVFAYRYAQVSDEYRRDVYYTVFDSLGNDVTAAYPLALNGIKHLKPAPLVVYPNPSVSTLYLELTTLEQVPYTVHDMQGRLLQQGNTSGAIRTELLGTGDYILRITENSETRMAKFSVQ
ncbi:MAG: Secretion system C-terminal sorting domain [Bacteroidota bacterium]|jgi:hypothetical protein